MVVEAGRSAAARETSSSAAAAMKKRLAMRNKRAEESGRTKKQTSHCTEPAPESPAGSCRLAVMRSLLSCRNNGSPADSRSNNKVCKQLKDMSQQHQREETACKRRASSVSKALAFNDLAASSNSKQLQRGGSSLSSSWSSGGGSSFRAGMQLRRLSGCYECHMALDPVAGSSSSMRLVCPDCGEIFVRQESLQLHQTIKHAVSELGAEDTSRNIIEIIFQSSWLKKQSPVCRIERILKVHNTARTLARFEEYRDAVKARASSSSSRCSADGNELLRFHCATLACQLGLNGATHLCLLNACAACAIIRSGFTAVGTAGVLTTATSGRAHDACNDSSSSWAMLVCRVIAGRVKRPHGHEEEEEFDSVAGSAGVYSNLEELQVFNPTAILPCFVVVYKASV